MDGWMDGWMDERVLRDVVAVCIVRPPFFRAENEGISDVAAWVRDK
jgi:hypothetical protein